MLTKLEDLESYKNNIYTKNKSISINDINEVEISGGESINSYSNKLFYWNFKGCYIKQLSNVYSELSKTQIDSKSLSHLKSRIRFISKEIINDNISPIEPILYSSKVINNLIVTDSRIIEIISNIIYDIYLKHTKQSKETIKFILKTWSWSPQIKILINVCSKIKDIELYTYIYDYNLVGENRLEALKSFMSFDNEKCIEYTLNLISKIEEKDEVEVQMAKYFINNYVKSFDYKSIEIANDYLKNNDVNKQSKKIISRSLPNIKEIENVTLNFMIKKSKNWDREDDFENIFTMWLNNDITRKNALLAIRYSNSKKVEELVLMALNNKCSSIEVGTAILTLAQWSSRNNKSKSLMNLIQQNKIDETKKIYCNAAMCSLGNEEETKSLIREFLEEVNYNSRHTFSIIRDCGYKSNKLLMNSIKIVYKEYLGSGKEEKIVKAINGAYELCNKPKFNFKNVVIPLIKKYIGIGQKPKKIFSDHIYISLVNLIEKLINDTNKSEFIDILFFIVEDKNCNENIKFKSISILKKLSLDPPR